MIVACPNCNSRYRAPDGGSAGSRLKCTKCGLIFGAATPPPVGTATVPSTGATPAPVPFDAAPAARTVSDPVGREWDSKVTGPLESVPAALPADDLLADILPPLPSMAAPPTADGAVDGRAGSQARDPFYEANPLVVEKPPADAPQQAPRMGYASQPAMAGFATVPGATAPAANPVPTPSRDPFGTLQPRRSVPPVVAAATPTVAPSYPGETSDPFANISLVAPAAAPVAGSDGAAEAPAYVAGPTIPASSTLSTVASQASIRFRDRSGATRDFLEWGKARTWATHHADPDGLEISVDDAPYEPVVRSPHMRGLQFDRRGLAGESFPPPPRVPVTESNGETTSLLSWLAVLLAAVFLVLGAGYALWQFEVLPLDPALSRMVSRVTGLHSPLAPQDQDVEKQVQDARSQAQAAQAKGALGIAIVHYRRVLLFRPDDAAARAALSMCFTQLGDRNAARSGGDTRTSP